jgi:hypothetical protein
MLELTAFFWVCAGASVVADAKTTADSVLLASAGLGTTAAEALMLAKPLIIKPEAVSIVAADLGMH